MAERILQNEFKSLVQEKWANIELENEDLFRWNVSLIVLNPDSDFYGGYFKGIMTFPSNYPYSPPGFRFVQPIYHPNIYEDGRLCISILHAPGEDEMSGESAAERWTPAQRVESVLISILSLLDDAEVSSPANVDASVMLRKEPERYRQKVKECVERSKEDIPEGFVMPTHESTMKPPEKTEDIDFWVDSDMEEDDDIFGGSDSDGELTLDGADTASEDDEDKE